ncbi:transporter substrate-binding domain-containing protein [Nocardioides sp.]|uniref:transporter substrate-binding domain-containing protein n=1 Tax=Nocardioides sp. TaxID=35761 RepID=UPI003D0CD5A4
MLKLAGSAAGLVILSAALAGCGSAEGTPAAAPLNPQFVTAGSLTVCTDMPYEPFESMKGGKPIGFDIDLIDAVAARLKVKPVIVDTDFDAIQSGDSLNSADCDVAISAMTITGERARVLDFSSPYFDASQAMVVPKDSDVKTLEDLDGKKIGVQGGTTGELYVTDNAPGDAEIVPFEDASAMDVALKGGEVDAAVYDNTVVGDVVARNPGFQLAAEFDTGEQYGMAVKKNGSVDLLRTINDVLADLKSQGGYDEIYSKWFGVAPAN